MPGTASNSSTRPVSKAKPSASVRAANLSATAPVLFRLPAIQNLAPSPAPEKPIAASASPALAVATEPAVAATASTTTPTAIVSPPAKPEEPTTKQTSKTGEIRSWWDHWSSGVLLIVMLIALIIAALFALQGRDGHNSKLIAEPAVDNAKVDNTAAAKLAEISVPNAKTTTSSSDQTPKSSDNEGSLVSAETSLPEASHNTSDVGLSLSQIEVPPTATASLANPVGNASPQLLPPQQFEGADSGVPAMPASTGTSGSPGLWDGSQKQIPPTTESGPLLLDSSGGGLSSNGSSSNGASQPSSSVAPPNNNTLPASSNTLPAQLVSQQVTLNEPVPPAPASATLAQPTPVATTSAPATAAVSTNRTTTPEFDRAALLRAYQEFTQAPQSTVGNRYPTQTSPTTTSSSASGTLPSNQPATSTVPAMPPIPPLPQ